MKKAPIAQESLPLGYLIKRVQNAFRVRMDEALTTHDLTTASYAVLTHLQRLDAASGSELARECWVTPQTMHRLTNMMEERGQIERTPSKGRALRFVLTDEGHRALDDAAESVDAIEEQMCRDLSAGEQLILGEMLRRSAEALEEEQSDGDDQ